LLKVINSVCIECGLLCLLLNILSMLILVEKIIAELFPFGFIMDENLEIINKGKSFLKFHAEKNQFADIFEIEKPGIVSKYGFETIKKNAGRVFMLTMKEHVPELKLKGTFIADKGKSLIFLGYPYVKNQQELLGNHLDKNDFGVIDSTIDLINELKKSENSVESLKKVNIFLASQAELLKIKEEELENFFTLSLDFMCLANTEGYFLKINPTFSKVLGHPEHELLSNTFLSFVHPDDLTLTINEIKKLSHGQLTINFENRFRKSDGTYIYLNWNCTPDPSSGLLYATARDMTEHKMVIEREQELLLEKEKTLQNNRMLEKLLPSVIAKRFLLGDTEIADYYPQVSILFADIVNFSSIVQLMPAMVVRKFLTLVFEHFDNIVQKHQCEKIKTIGDGYLAIAGAPEICEDHSERLTAVAMEMIKPFSLPDEINEYLLPQKYLSFRIGMNVGSIVGGVLGNSRPMAYDIWGDAVNIASRMQSSGEPDKIHVTADFVLHLKNRFALSKENKNIRFEKRGNIEIKHMGKIFTYYISSSDLKEKNEVLKPLQNLKTA